MLSLRGQRCIQIVCILLSAMGSPSRQPVLVKFDDDALPSPPPTTMQQSGEADCAGPTFSSSALPSPLPALMPAAATSSVPQSKADASGTAKSHKRRRGQHKRTASMGKRLCWKEWAKRHMMRIGNLLTKSHCSPGCSGCDVGSFGTKRVAELLATKTFGDAVLYEKWEEIVPNHTANATAFYDALEFVVKGKDSKPLYIDYKVDGHNVCSGTWGAFRGLTTATTKKIDRLLLKNEDVWNNGLKKQLNLANRAMHATLTQAASGWWRIRLGYYEMIVANGIIQYPRDLNFTNMYSDEFVPEMQGLPDRAPRARAGHHAKA
jgi:hypothetical protein